MSQLEYIHDKISCNTCIVVGGPSVDVNTVPDFFKKYPFIDYAIYGAGEVAFRDVISSLVHKKKLIVFNTSNVAWYDAEKKKQVVADYKYVPQLQWSPYLSNVEFLTNIIKVEQDKNMIIVLPYELTRGCPYSCTFCDWNSGLSNKTTRRKGTFKDEIDLFQKLKIQYLYLSDANVGQYEEDIEMISYIAQKNLEEGAGFKLDGNFSKLRKENNLKIYHIMAKGNAIDGSFVMSVQDINPTILKNINRPDVGWVVHKQMINELKE
jgi:tRNA A37 methylthiotransferase MiaB